MTTYSFLQQLFRADHIAIIGGGRFCRELLELLFNGDFSDKINILGVADLNEDAVGIIDAQSRGIYTTRNFQNLWGLPRLEAVLDLTPDLHLKETILKSKPPHVRLIDYMEARLIWSQLEIEKEKLTFLNQIKAIHTVNTQFEKQLIGYTDRIVAILAQRNQRFYALEQAMIRSERTMAQIIQGSTIPTFVINKDHIITHWNKALEMLTGYKAEDMVGTRNQWIPFWEHKRPSMADVIVDQIDYDEIKRFYGVKWRKSALVEGAYEAELFFPKLGERGRWCFFTAAPIKSQDGEIIGAIETFQDTTEDKKAVEEKERLNYELTTLVSIYTILSSSEEIQNRVQSAINEVGRFLSADSVCIYLLDDIGELNLSYHNEICQKECQLKKSIGEDSIIYQVAHTGEFTIYDELPEECSGEFCILGRELIQSLAYVPLSSKAGSTFGVIRLGSKNKKHFPRDFKDILQIIGNRIGVAIENALLQKQSIKSEEKYRTLFNNAPNNVFILDSATFEIVDINQRTLESYGYQRRELIGKSFLSLGDTDDAEIYLGLKAIKNVHSLLFAKKKHYRKGGLPVYVTINISHTQYGDRDVLIASTIDISESVERETQLIQAGKMTTLGQMAAGIAHEINQPLNVIQVGADLFLKMLRKGAQIDAAQLTSLANDISRNVQRATDIIKHLRDFARQSEVARNKVNINDPIQDVFKVLGYQVKSHDVELILELADDLSPILAEHNRLEQVFINLVTNAIDAMDEKYAGENDSNYDKRLKIRTFMSENEVVATVSDTGVGISEEIRDKIFEPFFTTKEVGKGTGLGVSISYGIIKDFNGTIRIDSQLGSGTTFTLKFPAKI